MSESSFTLSSGQYANLLGITKEALRSKRRRGQLSNEYIYQNGIYLWRAPASKVRSDQVVTRHSLPAARSRGAHREGQETKYPNYAFQKHNEIKMLARLKGQVDKEEQELLPEAMQLAKAKKRERLQKELDRKPARDYGGRIDPRIHFRDQRRKLQMKNIYETRLEDERSSGRGSSFFLQGQKWTYTMLPDQDKTPVDPGPIEKKPVFKNKVDEAIWRLKNKK